MKNEEIKNENEEDDIDLENIPEPELDKVISIVKKDPNLPEIGTYIYLTDMKIYGFVKSKIEDDLYEVVVNDFEQEMFLFPLNI